MRSECDWVSTVKSMRLVLDVLPLNGFSVHIRLHSPVLDVLYACISTAELFSTFLEIVHIIYNNTFDVILDVYDITPGSCKKASMVVVTRNLPSHFKTPQDQH